MLFLPGDQIKTTVFSLMGVLLMKIFLPDHSKFKMSSISLPFYLSSVLVSAFITRQHDMVFYVWLECWIFRFILLRCIVLFLQDFVSESYLFIRKSGNGALFYTTVLVYNLTAIHHSYNSKIPNCTTFFTRRRMYMLLPCNFWSKH